VKKRPILLAADLFCGAGGTSSGLLAACKANNIELQLIAINHWDVAIATHQVNHAYAKHLCQSIDNVDPRKLVPKGRLNVLIAGPECTHHSNARGGRPMSDQSRASAWHILRWAEALYIENILIENVKEFRSWGPLGANGRPIKKLKGQLYLNFIAALKALGYRVEDKVLNAADFGDPTTRERLFIIARRGNRPIVWPRPTHAAPKAESAQGQMFKKDKMKPWRTAREIIDWQLEGKSIFTRKRPLAPKTLDRIAAGLRKFGGANAEPFLLMLYGTGTARSVDRPFPTVTANGTHVGLVEPDPFVMRLNRPNDPSRSVDSPMATVTAQSSDFGLVEPFIVGAGGPVYAAKPRGVDQPLNTVMTENHAALVEPFMLEIDHQSSGDSVQSVDVPVSTVTTKARHCLVEPFLVPFFGERDGQNPRCHSVDDPLPAVTGHGAGGLVEPFLITVNHGDDDATSSERRAHSLDVPLGTLTTSPSKGLVEPFIIDVNHGGGNQSRSQSIEEPLKTVTTKRNKAVIEPFVLGQFGERRCRSVDKPLATITTTSRGVGLVEPFLTKYNGTAKAQSVNEPLDTVTTKDRFGLVETSQGTYRLDIRFRMLEPHELAAAQGLAGYKFTGKKCDVVKQIGNAVPKGLATSLCAELIQ
jgi:DNA (cytosine-5)-methyltransferase 1